MCSFLFSTNLVKNLELVNKFLKYRGPDKTSVVERDGYTLVHNLLSITGVRTEQPVIQGDFCLLYNGEIYNYKSLSGGLANCDTDILIPEYLKYGISMSQLFDGEFAFCLIDFRLKVAVIGTDIFSTKPLWYSFDGGFHVSTYKSALEYLGCTSIIRALPNESLKIDLKTFRIIERTSVHKFDLIQKNDSCEGWITAFEESIRKRATTDKGVFLGVSGGYDSGAILCELNKQKLQFEAYSIINNEDKFIINKRKKLSENFKLINFNTNTIGDLTNEMLSKIEPLDYPEKYKLYRKNLYDDQSVLGLMEICKQTSSKIYLSGQGADEIMSDYGIFGYSIYQHSTFNGKFPNDLSTIFPWKNFYYGAQECYLGKEEHVSGAYGKEGRYPFLDTQVVQEFLWLKSDLKNRHYKSPLYEYFVQNKYPFLLNEKNGFNPYLKP